MSLAIQFIKTRSDAFGASSMSPIIQITVVVINDTVRYVVWFSFWIIFQILIFIKSIYKLLVPLI